LPSAAEDGVLCFDRFATYLSSLPDSLRDRMGSCVRQDCESLALVPIRYGNQEIAVLHVADPRSGVITADLFKSLTTLASELGAAIHRVRVEEALQEARNHLELRVRERTEELTRSNEALQKEIEERGRLERELLQASVREQQRIGQELHDGLGQELTGISYLAQNLVMSLRRQASPEVSSAQELARGIQTVVGEIQNIVRGLVPLEIGAADLKPALEVLASNVEKQTGVTCKFETNGRNVIMEDGVAIQMYRIAQEAVSNAVKHAEADTICVTLLGTDQEVRLEVSDNGVGMPSDAGAGPGCGLRSMRHRARAIDGRLDVRQRPGGGTVVGCRVAHRSESGARNK
jgi:signal transduction histidine kinase